MYRSEPRTDLLTGWRISGISPADLWRVSVRDKAFKKGLGKYIDTEAK